MHVRLVSSLYRSFNDRFAGSLIFHARTFHRYPVRLGEFFKTIHPFAVLRSTVRPFFPWRWKTNFRGSGNRRPVSAQNISFISMNYFHPCFDGSRNDIRCVFFFFFYFSPSEYLFSHLFFVTGSTISTPVAFVFRQPRYRVRLSFNEQFIFICLAG